MVLGDSLFGADKLQAPGFLSEHSSAGFQSGARLLMDLEESCRTNTNAWRFEVPVDNLRFDVAGGREIET